MQIDANSLSPLVSKALTNAVRSGETSPYLVLSNADGTQNTSPATGSKNAGNSDDSANATGMSSALIGSDTARLLMKLFQSISDPQATDAANAASTSGHADSATLQTMSANLAVGITDIMQKVADDPAYAETYARDLMSPGLIAVRASDLVDASPEHIAAEIAKIDSAQNTVNALCSKLRDLYQQDKAQGKSSAQTVADMLQLQINQPQSYWDAYDPDHIETDAKGAVQAQLDLLQTAISTKSASSITADLWDASSSATDHSAGAAQAS